MHPITMQSAFLINPKTEKRGGRHSMPELTPFPSKPFHIKEKTHLAFDITNCSSVLLTVFRSMVFSNLLYPVLLSSIFMVDET